MYYVLCSSTMYYVYLSGIKRYFLENLYCGKSHTWNLVKEKPWKLYPQKAEFSEYFLE